MKKTALLLALITSTDIQLFAQVKVGNNPMQIVSGARLQVDGDSTTVTPSKFIVTSNGNTGIGTAAPGTSLDVAGAITIRETSIALSTGTTATIPANTSQVRLTGTATGTITITAAAAPNPGQHLIIYNNTIGGFPATLNGSVITNGLAKEYIFSNSSWRAVDNGSPSNWGNTGDSVINPATNFIGTTDNTDFVTRTNNTERIRVTGTGNVGINTSNPAARLLIINPSAGNPTDILELSINNCGAACSEGTARNLVLNNKNGTNTTFALLAIVPSGSASNPEGSRIMGIDRDTTKNLAGLDFQTRDTAGTAGNMLSRLTIRSNGRVGIGTTAPDQLLSVNGNASKTGGTTWAVFSDKRLKQDIRPFSDGLKQVLQIKPVFFKYNGKGGLKPSDKDEIGVIAQEIQQIAPYTVTETGRKVDGSGKGLLQLDRANAITYMLVNAVKEQQAELRDLKKRLQVQKDNTASLGSELKLYTGEHDKEDEDNSAAAKPLTASTD